MKEDLGCLFRAVWNGLALYGLYILGTQLWWLLTYKWLIF